ncbi:hypothetical protein ACIBUR_10030 [Streptomyces anulatus]
MPERQYAYDGKKECVVTVVASSREEADRLVREILGKEEHCGIQFENGVRITGETINEMPVFFDSDPA